jgi:outer membrane autotransporter protein
MIGYNLKAREDQKQYSLHIDSQNHYSVESGLGLNLEKEFMPYKDTKLKLSGGMAVYKEFADPYDLKVGMNEMSGNYKLKDETHGDKRTVLRFGAGYNVKENLDISAIIRTNIDRTNRTDAGVNLNYHFN